MPEFETVDDLVKDAAENAGYHTILEVWREVLRVLMPGAHLLAFGGTRSCCCTWRR